MWGGERVKEAQTPMWGGKLRVEAFYFFNPCLIFLGIDFVEKDCNISLFPVKVVPVNLFLGNFVGKLFPYCFWRFPSNLALRKHVNSSSQNIYSIKYTLTSLVVTAGAP
jgi:hypothetical protein